MNVDINTLKHLVPLNTLSPGNLIELAKKSAVVDVPANHVIFKPDDEDDDRVYLLSGEVLLIPHDGEKAVVTGGSVASRYELDPYRPHRDTVRSQTAIQIVRVNSNLLDVLLPRDITTSYEVSELDVDDDEDWMTRLLRSPIFQRLAASDIQQVMLRMDEYAVEKGTVVIRQETECDYYYYIKEGTFAVVQKTNSSEEKIAELIDGQSFGEEAAASSELRNASVIALTDGVLMRLHKNDFVALILHPLIPRLNYSEAIVAVDRDAILLDVRAEEEFYSQGGLDGGRNIPLRNIRSRLDALKMDERYIVYCDTGSRSSAAAFLLVEHGFDASILSGGLIRYGRLSAVELGNKTDLSGVERKRREEESRMNVVDDTLERAKKEAAELIAAAQTEAERIRSEGLAARTNAEQEAALLKQKAEHMVVRFKSEAGKFAVKAKEIKVSTALESEKIKQEQLHLEIVQAKTQLDREQVADDVQRIESKQNDINKKFDEVVRLKAEAEAVRKATDEEYAIIRAEQKRLKQRIHEAQSLGGKLREERKNAEQKANAVKAKQAEAQSKLDAAMELQADVEQRKRDAEIEACRVKEAQTKAEEKFNAAVRIQAEVEAARKLAEDAAVRVKAEQEEANNKLREVEKIQQEVASQRRLMEQGAVRIKQEEETARLKFEEIELLQAEVEMQHKATQRETLRIQQENDDVQEKWQQALAFHAEVETTRAAFATEMERISREKDAAQIALEEAERLQVGVDAARQAAEDATQRIRLEREEVQTKLRDAVKMKEEVAAERRLAEEQTEKAKLVQAQAQQRLDAARQLQESAVAAQAVAEQQIADMVASHDEAGRLEVELSDAQAQAQAAAAIGVEAERSKSQAVMELEQAEERKEQLKRKLDEAEWMQTQVQAASQNSVRDSQLVQAEWQKLEQKQNEMRSLRERAQSAQRAVEEESQKLDAQRRETQLQLEEVVLVKAEAERARQQLMTDADGLHAQELEVQRKLDEVVRAKDEAASARRATEEAAEKVRVEQQTVLLKTSEAEQLKQAAELVRHQAEVEFQKIRSEQLDVQSKLDEVGAIRAEAESNREAVDKEAINARLQNDQAEQKLVEAEKIRDAAEEQRRAVEIQVAQLRSQQDDMQQRLADVEKLRLAAEEKRKGVEDDARRVQKQREKLNKRIETRTAALQQELIGAKNRLHDTVAHKDKVEEAFDKAQEDSNMLMEELEAAQVQIGVYSEMVENQKELETRMLQERGKWPIFGWIGIAFVVAFVAALGLVATGVFDNVFNQSVVDGKNDQHVSVAVANTTAESGSDVGKSVTDKIGELGKTAPVVVTNDDKISSHTDEKSADAVRRVDRVVKPFRDKLKSGGMGPEMISIDSGEFLMGSRPIMGHYDELPQHKVMIRRFAVSRYEVRYEEYDRFVKMTGKASSHRGKHSHPVTHVSWQDSSDYAQWLGRQTHKKYRLPTEAEWEYIAGAGSKSRFWWGTKIGVNRASCLGCGSVWDKVGTAPVGSFQANPMGVFDTAGNVGEWVLDCYHANYQTAPNDGSARQTDGCKQRVVRGGAFDRPADSLRSTKRIGYSNSATFGNLGFRLVREY